MVGRHADVRCRYRLKKQQHLFVFQFGGAVLLVFIFRQFLLQETDAAADRYLLKPVYTQLVGDPVPVQVKRRNDPAVACTLDQYDAKKPYGQYFLQSFWESSFNRV